MDETEEKVEGPGLPQANEGLGAPERSEGPEVPEDEDRAPPGLEPPLELLASAAPMPEVRQFSNELSDEERNSLKRILMAMLFASTEPLSASRLSEAVGLSIAPIKELLEELREDSLRPSAVFELKKHGDGWRLYTKEEFYPYLVRLRSLKKVERLTPAALETLAIIAYRQPVIRAEIEAIRGVKVGPMLRALLDRKLVSIVGRANVPGAPFQYGTTKTFLERFGLESLADLPSLKEFQQGRI
jgi:segregation and condensation protein B